MPDQLQIIYQKLQELIKKHQLTQKELQKIEQENVQLKAELLVSKNHTKELSNHTTNQNFQTRHLSLEEKKKLEKRINSYLSEIEKCLALMDLFLNDNFYLQ